MSYLLIKIFLRLIAYSLFALVFLSLYFLYGYVCPKRFISGITPSDLGLVCENITLKTKDGVDLAGWFIPQKKSHKAIIVCHGYPADKGSVLGMAAFLTPRYNLLFFDFRALGKSQGKFSTGGWREREDFLSAVKFLKDKGFEDIGAFGFSMGAAVILMSNSPDVKAIVSDSSYASLSLVLELIFQNFGYFRYPLIATMKLWAKLFFKVDVDKVSPARYISQIRSPVFLMHSELDSQIPLTHAQLLHNENPQNKLWIIPQADHGGGFASRQEEYENKVLGFFDENL